MKITFGNIISIIVIIGVILLFLLFKRGKSVPDGFVLVNQQTIDSINAIANSKPDTVIKVDTVWTKPTVKWFQKIVHDSIIVYVDTFKNDEIEIYASNDSIGYQLLKPHEIIRTVEITKEVPVIVQMPCVVKKWYGVIGAGGNSNLFILSGELGFEKNNRKYGIEIERFSGQFIYKLKTGIKF